MLQNGANQNNQCTLIKMHLNCIKAINFILYIGFIITMAYTIKEFLSFSDHYDPTGKNLEQRPISQIQLEDQCEQGYETISYNIQSTVQGCFCQGNRRYQCSSQQILTQGCIPIQNSTGTSLSKWPILPRSKWYRGTQICVKYYNGLNIKQQIENKILFAQDCTGDYKICGNEIRFFCINKLEQDCPISDVIFTNTTIINTQNITLVSNLSNAYFLYRHNQTSSYITDIKFIDGQGVCQNKDQISLSKNKTGYELDIIPESDCLLDESYQMSQEINYQIFQKVNNFSFQNFFSITRPYFQGQELSNIKMYIQHTQIITVQCRQKIYQILFTKESLMLYFQIFLYLQLIFLLLCPILNFINNKKSTYASTLVCFLALGLGIYQLCSIYGHLAGLKQMFDICQFKNYQNDLYYAILLQLGLTLIYLICLILNCANIYFNKQLDTLNEQINQQNQLQQQALIGQKIQQDANNPEQDALEQNDQENDDQNIVNDALQVKGNQQRMESIESNYTFRKILSPESPDSQ